MNSTAEIPNAPRSRRRWWHRRITKLALVAAAALGLVIGLNSTALASGSFENNQTIMIIRDNGQYVGTVEVAIWTGNGARGNVHARVWGAGFSGFTQSQNVGRFTTYRGYIKVNRVLPVGSKICAEGFWGTQSVGLPCATIKA